MPFLVTIIGILRDWAGTKRPNPHLNIRHSTVHDIWAESDGSDGGRRSYIRLVTGAQLANLANSRYSRIGGSYHVRFWSYGGVVYGLSKSTRSEVLAKPSRAKPSQVGCSSEIPALSLSGSRGLFRNGKIILPRCCRLRISDKG